LSSGTPAWTIGPPLGRKTSSTVQSKLPVARRPSTVPASLDDLRFRALRRTPASGPSAVRAAARLVAVENLEAAEHPGALLAAGAEGPATGDPVAAIDGHGRVPPPITAVPAMTVSAPVRVDLVDAFVRQAERDELADAVVGHDSSRRARALGQELDDARRRSRIDLQAAHGARHHML
jgi:hypothetical protein